MDLEGEGGSNTFTVSLPVSIFPSTSGKAPAAPVPLEKIFCHYLCQICGAAAIEPVLNIVCGHLFCWGCIYKFSNTSKFCERCPACSSHMDISRADHNATIIPVYSGPKPGIFYNPMQESEPEVDGEEVKKMKEEVVPCGETCIPPPPTYSGGSRYGSAFDLVFWMLDHLDFMVTVDVKPYLKELLNVKHRLEELCDDEDPIEDVADMVESEMASCIELLQEGMQWVQGGKTRNKNNANQHVSNLSTGNLEQDPHQYKYKSRIILFPGSSEHTSASNPFRCKICCKPAYEPVVTRCGHLFCWSCLYLKFDCKPGTGHIVVNCPFCKVYMDIYDGYIVANPIYCGGGLRPEMEDELLVKGRRSVYKSMNKLNEILCFPRRPNPVLACMFMHHMFEEYEKEDMEMKKRFEGLVGKRCNIKTEDVDHFVKETENSLDLLNQQLTKKWEEILSRCRDMNEHCLLEDKVSHWKAPIDPCLVW